jgi:hypothetical protein
VYRCDINHGTHPRTQAPRKNDIAIECRRERSAFGFVEAVEGVRTLADRPEVCQKVEQ